MKLENHNNLGHYNARTLGEVYSYPGSMDGYCLKRGEIQNTEATHLNISDRLFLPRACRCVKKSLFSERIERGLQAFIHGYIVQKTCDSQNVVDLRGRVA